MKENKEYRHVLLERLSTKTHQQNLKSSKGSSAHTQCTPNQSREFSASNLINIFEHFDNNFYVYNEPVKLMRRSNFQLKRPLADQLKKIYHKEMHQNYSNQRIAPEDPYTNRNKYPPVPNSRKASSRCTTQVRQEKPKALNLKEKEKSKIKIMSKYRSLKVIPSMQTTKTSSICPSLKKNSQHEQSQLKRANSSKCLQIQNKNKSTVENKSIGKSLLLKKIVREILTFDGDE